MNDISSFPYALKPVEEIEPNSRLNMSLLSDKVSLMEMGHKKSPIFLKMGEKKVMIMQDR